MGTNLYLKTQEHTEIIIEGANVSDFVHEAVREKLARKKRDKIQG